MAVVSGGYVFFLSGLIIILDYRAVISGLIIIQPVLFDSCNLIKNSFEVFCFQVLVKALLINTC